MTNKLKQRFVDLEVGEVSIVNSPANEEEFVVIKNLYDIAKEEVNMPDEAKEIQEQSNEGNESEGNENVTKAAVEVEKATTEAASKAMEKVTEMVETISKAFGTINKGNEETESPEGDQDKSTEKNAAQEEESQAKEGEGAADVEKAAELALEALSSAVEKAKRMTPKREEAFKQALQQLATLAKELGMTEIPVGTSPGVSAPSGASYGASSISKSLDDFTKRIEEVVGDFQKTAKSLSERVEKIENARMPSKSVEEEGGNDTTENVSKSLWHGVL